MKYGIFVSTSNSYIPWLNALLNSLEKYKIQAEVNILHYKTNPDYLKDIENAFSYPIILHELKRDDLANEELSAFKSNMGYSMSNVDFCRTIRLKYILELGIKYDAVCLLDADMFIVSEEFEKFFDLVSNTSITIGCEEFFKWSINDKYTYRNKPIFNKKVRLKKFACSVPIFLDIKKWIDVFEFCHKLNIYGKELRVGEKIDRHKYKPISDMFGYNIAVKYHDREKDIILLPMQLFTQVHSTSVLPWCHIKEKWLTSLNEQIFSIHGKVGLHSWERERIALLKKFLNKYEIPQESYKKHIQRAKRSVKMLQQEWLRLNTDGPIKLSDYMVLNDEYYKENT